MKKYLDEMTTEELIHLAMQECIFLELTFNREKTIKKLEQKGYERIKESGSLPEKEKVSAIEEKVCPDEENENIEKKGGYEVMKEDLILKEEESIKEEIEVEEVDFSVESIFPYRSRSYYRNYPNRKLMRSVIRIHRGNRREAFKEFSFNYKDIDEEQIKKRETETEINRSKFAKGADYDGKSKQEDIYFDKAYLPNSYFVDEVVLMPKNPTTLFVYWEIRDDTFERLSKNNHIIDNIVIKLMKDGHEYKKIIRHERIGSHYITEVDASQSYEVLIGYEDQYGNFSEVAHSAEAIVPSDKLSDNFDLLWGTVKEDKNTNQIIKYINSPIPTPENKEFIELSNGGSIADDEEFTVEVLERLLKVGASEQLIERRERKVKPDKLIMIGSSSSK
ncbi:DUF4912 domain-containing protein [Leptotrichia sp. oral taxon 212]|jgi:hypothetical protein|uniref:DUF4912 domain-containing protein n=1 Tax=Leptotrichia sp. oral taxon 212 TaxID=712357 RepID=UPI000840F82F|nr:DUF4912 domain-containing protein [Leptotrichia sp. oral taxon 212]